MPFTWKFHAPCICHHAGMLHLGGKPGLVCVGRRLVEFLRVALLAIPCLKNCDNGGKWKGICEGAGGLDGDVGQNSDVFGSERPEMGWIRARRVHRNLNKQFEIL
jgi:hypothetical protein